MSRRKRHMETSEVALMAVMTKAMGAFLILMVFGMKYYLPDFTSEEIARIVRESLNNTKSDIARIDQKLAQNGTAGNSQLRSDIAQAMARLDKTAADMDRMRIRLDQANSQLRRSEDERNRLMAEDADLKSQLDAQRALAHSLQTQLSSVTAERDQLAAELKSLAQARQDLAQAANTLKRGDITKAEFDAIKKQVENALARIASAEVEVAQYRSQLDRAKADIEQLQSENQKLADTNKNIVSERDGLRDENGRLKAALSKKVSTSLDFTVLFSKECGDARLSIAVSRLMHGDNNSARSVIQSAGSNLWSATVQGDTFANLDASSSVYEWKGDPAESPKYENALVWRNFSVNAKYTSWRWPDIEAGDRFVAWIIYTNALDGGKHACDATLDIHGDAIDTVNTATQDIDEAKYSVYGPYGYEVRENKLTRLDFSKEERDWLVSLFFKQNCVALFCDVHGKGHRAELHELLSKRHSNDLIITEGIDDDEKQASIKMLDDLIEQFGDRKIQLSDIERWIPLLKTSAVPSKEAIAAKGQRLPTALEIGLLRQRLAFGSRALGVECPRAPNAVQDRFKARALKGWWSYEDLLARFAAANVPSTGAIFTGVVKEMNQIEGPNRLVDIARPLVERGIMNVGDGAVWISLAGGNSPTTDTLDEAALAKTEDEMRKKGLEPFIPDIEAMVRAKRTSLKEVNDGLAFTKPPEP